MKMATKKNIASFVLFILLVIAIEWLGHLMTYSSVNDWYRKPTWNPPPYVFGPVWTIIYLMIAVAGWRIYTKAPSSKQKKESIDILRHSIIIQFILVFFLFLLAKSYSRSPRHFSSSDFYCTDHQNILSIG